MPSRNLRFAAAGPQPARTLTFGVALGALFAALVLFTSAATPARAAQAHHAMVVAENAQAARIGLNVLKHGGNAVDAAVATELALGVTNAGSCGIGGGGFMLIYIAKTHSFYALDYRETAPAAASPTMYIRNGKPDQRLALVGPLAVGVPGELYGMDTALKRFGTMKFSQVAAPAIALAEHGFPVTPLMVHDLTRDAPIIAKDPGLKAIFLSPSGAPPKAGKILYAKALAGTLRSLGNHPVRRFYHGKIANEIARWMKAHGGIITAKDLAHYRPVWGKPVHLGYRGYEVYSMPPPSSGGVVLEMLGMLAKAPLAGLGVNSPPYLARLIKIMREGFIDRAQYADPAFVHVPIDELLSQHHIDEALKRALQYGPHPQVAPAHDHGTSNLLVVDKDHDVVAATTTVNTILGAKVMVRKLGLVLNDEMDDFAIAPGVPNVFKLRGVKANEIEPGKRPLSSMSPTIVMRNGNPVLAVGASGGPLIITGVLQVTLDVLSFHLAPAAAVALPRLHRQASPDYVLVESAMPKATRQALTKMGFHLKVFPKFFSAVGAIEIRQRGISGAFDPRKGGAAVGM